jgi:hypothetical protein
LKLRTDLSLLLAGCAALTFAGCRQDMHDQPRTYPLRGSPLFADGRSARPLVQGTVARGFLREDVSFYTGLGPDGKPAAQYPYPVTGEVLQRGRERFQIYCTPCHDRSGTGNGMIPQRGFRRPPSYHIDRLRQAPPGHFVDVMTQGFGAMPDYAAQVAPHDRWAIAAYIKTLQFSQNAPAAELPEELRSRLGGPPAGRPPAAEGRGNAAAPESDLPPSHRIPVPERPERKDRK